MSEKMGSLCRGLRDDSMMQKKGGEKVSELEEFKKDLYDFINTKISLINEELGNNKDEYPEYARGYLKGKRDFAETIKMKFGYYRKKVGEVGTTQH